MWWSRCRLAKPPRPGLNVLFFNANSFVPRTKVVAHPDTVADVLRTNLPSSSSTVFRKTTTNSGAPVFLVVSSSNGEVVGRYFPPVLCPFPKAVPPQGITVDDYLKIVAKPINIFCMLVGEQATTLFTVDSDKRQLVTPPETMLLRRTNEKQIHAQKHGQATYYKDLFEYLKKHNDVISSCDNVRVKRHPDVWHWLLMQRAMMADAVVEKSNRRKANSQRASVHVRYATTGVDMKYKRLVGEKKAVLRQQIRDLKGKSESVDELKQLKEEMKGVAMSMNEEKETERSAAATKAKTEAAEMLAPAPVPDIGILRFHDPAMQLLPMDLRWEWLRNELSPDINNVLYMLSRGELQLV